MVKYQRQGQSFLEGIKSGVMFLFPEKRDFLDEETYERLGKLGKMGDELAIITDHPKKHLDIAQAGGVSHVSYSINFSWKRGDSRLGDMVPEKLYFGLEEGTLRRLTLQPSGEQTIKYQPEVREMFLESARDTVILSR